MKACTKHPRWHDGRWEDDGDLLAARCHYPDGIDVTFIIYPI